MKYKEANIERFYKAKNPNLVTENKGVLFYNTGIFGSGRDNAMPQYMIELQSYSSIHSNFLQLKEAQVLGDNLSIKDSLKPKADELEIFMKKRNKAGDNLLGIYTKLAADISLFESNVIQVLFDRNGKIAEIYHVPVEDFRLGVPNEYGRIEYGYISKNWAQISNAAYKKATAQNSAVQVRMWSPKEWREHPVQVIYAKKYSAGMNYAVPRYLSSTNEILLNAAISTYGLVNARNNYFLSGMLTQQGNPNDKEMKDFIETFTSLYSSTGSINTTQQKMLFSWVDDIASQAPQYTPFQSEGTDIFSTQLDSVNSAIISSHNGYAGLIFEDKGSNISGDSNKLFTQTQLFYSNVSAKLKEIVLGGLNMALEINGYPILTSIYEPPKITMPQTNVDDLTETERRQIVFGLPPKKTDDNINEDKIPTQ